MSTSPAPAPAAASSSKAALWAGRILSAIPVLMLLASGAGKIAHPPQMVEMFTTKFGYPAQTMTPIGVVEILCALCYLFPRTAVLGAILITGYLGGAVATHVRASDMFVAPVLLGVFAWGGLYFRDPRVRALLPLR